MEGGYRESPLPLNGKTCSERSRHRSNTTIVPDKSIRVITRRHTSLTQAVIHNNTCTTFISENMLKRTQLELRFCNINSFARNNLFRFACPFHYSVVTCLPLLIIKKIVYFRDRLTKGKKILAE